MYGLFLFLNSPELLFLNRRMDSLIYRAILVLFCNIPMGATGFGDAIFLYVLLSLFGSSATAGSSELMEALLLITFGGLGSMAIQTLLLWKRINWKLTIWLTVPISIFTIVGMWSLQHLSEYTMTLKRLLGMLFLFVSFFKLRQEIMLKVNCTANGSSTSKNSNNIFIDPFKEDSDKIVTIGAGICSGFLAGLYGTGGPPLMVWVSTYNVAKDEWRASNAMIWLVTNIFRVLYIIVFQERIESGDAVGLLSVLFIVGAIGAALGSKASEFLGEYSFRIVIIVLLILGANTMLFAGRPVIESLAGILVTFLLSAIYGIYFLAGKTTSTFGIFSELFSVGVLNFVYNLFNGDSNLTPSDIRIKYTPLSVDDPDDDEENNDFKFDEDSVQTV